MIVWLVNELDHFVQQRYPSAFTGVQRAECFGGKCADQTAPVGCAIEPLVVNDGKPRPLLFVNDPMHVKFDAPTSHIEGNLKARQGVFRRETCGAAMSDNNEARSQIQRVGIHVQLTWSPDAFSARLAGMSYEVLARKLRPSGFSALVGQDHVVRALTHALDHDRLHHAYLFTGTRGVGKTTIARILAKSLNCEQGVSSTPCGECSICVEVKENRFIDLIEVDAASRTGGDDTRELLENAQYMPTRGRYKVYLIDEVHMLSIASFNALLKTLEEPPEHVKFLLATTDPRKSQ